MDNYADIKQALARDLLRKVLTTPCNGAGELPFTTDEQAWARRIAEDWMSGKSRPMWAASVMEECGF